MKNISLTMCILLVLGWSQTFAQKDKKGKLYKECWYKETKVETPSVTFEVVDIFANDEVLKFKLRLTNKTNDYLCYDPSNMEIQINGRTEKPIERPMLLEPNGTASRVVNISGGDLRVANFALVLKGLNRIPTDVPALTSPDFKLPAEVNTFEVGKFLVMHKMTEKKTDYTGVKFEIKYNGSGVGFFDPTAVSMKMPSGNVFANMSTRRKGMVLFPGDSDGVLVSWRDINISNGDMQFANMLLMFGNAFKESKLVPLGSSSVNIEFDPGYTDGKN